MVYVNFAIIDLLTYFEKHLNPLQPDKILLNILCVKKNEIRSFYIFRAYITLLITAA